MLTKVQSPLLIACLIHIRSSLTGMICFRILNSWDLNGNIMFCRSASHSHLVSQISRICRFASSQTVSNRGGCIPSLYLVLSVHKLLIIIHMWFNFSKLLTIFFNSFVKIHEKKNPKWISVWRINWANYKKLESCLSPLIIIQSESRMVKI